MTAAYDIPATRRELDHLAALIVQLDMHGGRVAVAHGEQLRNIMTQLSDYRSEQVTRWSEHSRLHEAETAAWTSARRFRIAATIAAVSAFAAILSVLVAILVMVG